jgi:hypothetical protein
VVAAAALAVPFVDQIAVVIAVVAEACSMDPAAAAAVA